MAILTEENIMALLAATPLCSSLTPKQLSYLASGTRLTHTKSGQVLHRKGEFPGGFYYVISGQVKLSVFSNKGTEKIIDVMRTGQTFGEALVFLHKPLPLNIESLSACQLLKINDHTIINAIKLWPDFSLHLLAGLSQHLHHLVADLESCCLQSATQRVVNYLLVEMQLAGLDEHQMPLHLNLSTSKTTIAAQLNLSPETFSRTLKSLAEKNLLTCQGRGIEIHDLATLRLQH